LIACWERGWIGDVHEAWSLKLWSVGGWFTINIPVWWTSTRSSQIWEFTQVLRENIPFPKMSTQGTGYDIYIIHGVQNEAWGLHCRRSDETDLLLVAMLVTTSITSASAFYCHDSGDTAISFTSKQQAIQVGVFRIWGPAASLICSAVSMGFCCYLVFQPKK
jgi:hypothetical protein